MLVHSLQDVEVKLVRSFGATSRPHALQEILTRLHTSLAKARAPYTAAGGRMWLFAIIFRRSNDRHRWHVPS